MKDILKKLGTKEFDTYLRGLVTESLDSIKSGRVSEGEKNLQDEFTSKLGSLKSDDSTKDEDFEEAEDSDEDEDLNTSDIKSKPGVKFKTKTKETPKRAKSNDPSHQAQQVKSMPDFPNAQGLQNVSLVDIMKTLNKVRSGKSLSDENIKTEIGEYFNSLDLGERQSLVVLLTSLARIMIAGSDGEKMIEPKELGIDTQASKQKSKENRPTAKKQAKKHIATIDKDSNNDEPIVVGEAADKTSDMLNFKLLAK